MTGRFTAYIHEWLRVYVIPVPWIYHGSTIAWKFPGIQSLHPKVLNSLLHQNLLFLYLFVPLVPFLQGSTKQTNPKSQRTKIAWAGNPIPPKKMRLDFLTKNSKRRNFQKVTQKMVDSMCFFFASCESYGASIGPRGENPSSMTPCSKRCSSACAISWCFWGDRKKMEL